MQQLFPQFATKNERGEPQQQDANECFTEVLRSIAGELDLIVSNRGINFYNIIQNFLEPTKSEKLTCFFEMNFDCKLKCMENEEEPEETSTEKHFQVLKYLGQEGCL